MRTAHVKICYTWMYADRYDCIRPYTDSTVHTSVYVHVWCRYTIVFIHCLQCRYVLTTESSLICSSKGHRCSGAGKVIVGLASHWPSITDLLVYPCMGLMAYVREMRTLLKPMALLLLLHFVW